MSVSAYEPAKAVTRTLPGGGALAEVHVPTYSGVAVFSLIVERDVDGDWRVFIPWPEDGEIVDQQAQLDDGRGGYYEVSNGILYLGAPDTD
jgi:hypothetical protein